MKFAHMADCHIGSWRDPKLKDSSTKAFLKAVDICISRNVDFVLISGDLFNTALPAIDKLKEVVIKLRELSEHNIPVYVIAGSHDFSHSGKTILDVLEEARLLTNVVKGEVINSKLKLNFTVDKKTNVKITGMLGKKGMLERKYYEDLIHDNLLAEDGYKIFMFHTALTELKPKELERMDSAPISLLPKGFDYYAAGHVHIVKEGDFEGYKNVVYPGPLFPNSFSEIEKLSTGGFYIVDGGLKEYVPVVVHNTFSIHIKSENHTPEQIEAEILSKIKNQEFINTIVTIRVSGTLSSGRVTDINFKDIFKKIYDKSAFFVMKSTSLLRTKEFEEVFVDTSDVNLIEDMLIKEHLMKFKVEGFTSESELSNTKKIMDSLDSERGEGERVEDFSYKLKNEIRNLLNIHDLF